VVVLLAFGIMIFLGKLFKMVEAGCFFIFQLLRNAAAKLGWHFQPPDLAAAVCKSTIAHQVTLPQSCGVIFRYTNLHLQSATVFSAAQLASCNLREHFWFTRLISCSLREHFQLPEFAAAICKSKFRPSGFSPAICESIFGRPIGLLQFARAFSGSGFNCRNVAGADSSLQVEIVW